MCTCTRIRKEMSIHSNAHKCMSWRLPFCACVRHACAVVVVVVVVVVVLVVVVVSVAAAAVEILSVGSRFQTRCSRR
jgi:hypothetical protein